MIVPCISLFLLSAHLWRHAQQGSPQLCPAQHEQSPAQDDTTCLGNPWRQGGQGNVTIIDVHYVGTFSRILRTITGHHHFMFCFIRRLQSFNSATDGGTDLEKQGKGASLYHNSQHQGRGHEEKLLVLEALLWDSRAVQHSESEGQADDAPQAAPNADDCFFGSKPKPCSLQDWPERDEIDCADDLHNPGACNGL